MTRLAHLEIWCAFSHCVANSPEEREHYQNRTHIGGLEGDFIHICIRRHK